MLFVNLGQIWQKYFHFMKKYLKCHFTAVFIVQNYPDCNSCALLI